YAGLEQESIPPSTFKDDGIREQIITHFNVENESLSAECPNSFDDCLAHFADSNDPMIRDIVNALQDNISVVFTIREHTFSEAPYSTDPEF
ncbi:hypothetical protein PJP10_31895, partial [Mycobacterium kansasii]